MKMTIQARRIITGLTAIILGVCLIPAASLRADAQLTVSVNGKAEIGSEIEVSLSATGDGPYQNFDGSFSYDSSILQFESLNKGPYEKATFKLIGSSFTAYDASIPNGSALVIAKFKCIAAGTAKVSFSLEALADMNGNAVTFSGGSKNISVTTPIPQSGNADLKSLSISPGTLYPAFSAGTQSYSATVASNQNKITVSASPSDGKASVSLNGVQNNLVTGSNTVKVTVTAENGTTKVYTITVARSTGPTPTPAPTMVPLPLMTYNGKDYTILLPGSADSIPEGFTSSTAKYKGVDIPVLQKTLGDAVDASVMTIVLLTGEPGTSFFVYDAASQTCYPYMFVSSSAQKFQILDKISSTTIPNGYEAFEYKYMESVITAYRLISDPSNLQILMNLMDENGISAFYYYDTQSSMLLPYRGEVTIILATQAPTAAPTKYILTDATGATVPTASTPAAPENTPARITFRSLADYTNPVVLLIYLIALLCLILLIVCIVMIAKRGNEYESDEYGYYPDEEEEDTFASENPVVSPTPKVYFNEFAQPKEDNRAVYGDKTHQEETKLDFPVLTARREIKPIPAAPETSKTQPEMTGDHVPVRLRHDMEAKNAQNNTLSPKAQINDPDFDPDDE